MTKSEAKVLRNNFLWHMPSAADILTRLETSDGGLTTAEALIRLEKYGRNRLPEKPPLTLWQVFVRQFTNPLIYILGIAAIVATATGAYKDAAFIVAVLLINALIGSYQEAQAERSTHALQKLLRIRASVLRDGEVRDIDAEELVPGDNVWLESGNRVPADLRLLGAKGAGVGAWSYRPVLPAQSVVLRLMFLLPIRENLRW
jgi:magnesium-transporting ATPase (P-type)